MKKIIYRTVIQYTVLSESPISEYTEMDEIVNNCLEGDCVGTKDIKVLNQEVVGKRAVKMITEAGSNPEDLRMDCEGNDLDRDD